MSNNVFTYGTLMCNRVWSQLVPARYHGVPCRLDGYDRRTVRDREYPGLVADADSHVNGIAYLNVSDGDLERIDHFEGEQYRRIQVTAVTGDGRPIECHTYLFREDRLDDLTDKRWECEEFLETGMEKFLRNFSGWSTTENPPRAVSQ